MFWRSDSAAPSGQRSRNIRAIVILIALGGLVALATVYLPSGIDWRETYRPAALALLSGRSPFEVEIYFAAPWTLLPFIPIALLPEQVGRGILFVVGLCSFAYAGHRLGAKPVALAAFLLSPTVMHCLLNSNIEWLPLLGVILPAQIGLFLVVIKPQIGLGVATYWLVASFRDGGVRAVLRVFWPITLATVVSIALFGLWPLRFRETLTLTQGYNASLWPNSIPVGLALLAAAFSKRELKYSLAASPCLSPYVLLHAWVGALAASLSSTAVTVAAVLGLWILVFIRAATGAL